MIYTLTLNPSIDHYIRIKRTEKGSVNRASSSRTVCGGKGINVSIALSALGIGSTALGFCGGFTGDRILSELDRLGIAHAFVRTSPETRINTKLITDDGVTEINSPGSPVSETEAEELLHAVSRAKADDTVILSGSVPPGFNVVPLLETIKRTEARFIADSSGETLRLCLGFYPYLIKPNAAELHQLTGGGEDIAACVRKISGAAEKILVSDGEKGAYLFDGNGERTVGVTDAGLPVINPTGSGDSMIAGFIFGELNGVDPLVCAVSAGSATAYSENIFDIETFYRVLSSYRGFSENSYI